MNIKALLQNRRILLTLVGVLLVAVVIGAIYLPGTLFRGALTPTITAPISDFQPTSPEVITYTTITESTTTTETAAVPSNMAAPEETADEEINMAYVDMLSDSNVGGITSVSLAESELSGLTEGNYTTTTETAEEGETSSLAVTGESSTLSELAYSGDLSVIDNDTFTYLPELSPAADTPTEYSLNCEPVSLSDLQDFRAGREMQWKAEITPAVSQTIIYTWSGNELLATNGNPVNALYQEAGTYYVTAIATPVETFATNVAGPITEPLFDRCSVEILPAEQSSSSDAISTITLSTLDHSNDLRINSTTDETTTTEDQTATYSLTEGADPTVTYCLTEGADPTVTYSLTGELEDAAEEEKTVTERTVTAEETTVTEETDTAEEETTVTERTVTTEETTVTEETDTTEEETTVTQVPVTQTTTTVTTEQNLSKCGTPYPDDIAGHWAESYIKKGYDECLFTGIDGKFHPDWEIYRMEAASMLLYALGMEPNLKCFDNDCGTPFNDLPSPKEGGIIQPLFDKGLIEGYSRTLFKPKGFLTRAEGASMIVRAFFEPFGRLCTDPHCGAGWPDNFFYDIHDQWQGQYIRVLWDKDILTGSGPNRVEPDNYITRAEMAKMIVMAYEETK